MSSSLPSPSKIRIQEASLYSYDGKIENLNLLITEINLFQSLDASAFNGSIKLQDNVNLLEGMPIRGEERLILTIISNDTNTKKELDLQIYRVDNISSNDANDGVSYYLHFVSRISFESSKRRVIEAMRENDLYPSASLMARRIFSKYFSKISNNSATSLPFAGQSYSIGNTNRNFIIQPTEGLMHGVIPNYTPSEAMYFLSTKAYISENGFTSCSFRFFETLDDFYFVSDEYLIKYAVSENKVLKLVNAPQVSKDPKYLGQQIVSIESIEYPKRVDTAEDLHSGGYANRVIELDFMRKRVNLPEEQYFIYSKDSSFLDMNGKKHTPESYIHTQNFMEDTFTEENAKRFIVFRDYSRTGDIPGPLATNQFITEIIQRRVSYYHHLNSTAIAVSIKGRLDIAPGNVIELEMQELNASTNKSRNSQLSGNYLVHTVNNSVIGEELNTNLKLVKYDWSI